MTALSPSGRRSALRRAGGSLSQAERLATRARRERPARRPAGFLAGPGMRGCRLAVGWCFSRRSSVVKLLADQRGEIASAGARHSPGVSSWASWRAGRAAISARSLRAAARRTSTRPTAAGGPAGRPRLARSRPAYNPMPQGSWLRLPGAGTSFAKPGSGGDQAPRSLRTRKSPGDRRHCERNASARPSGISSCLAAAWLRAADCGHPVNSAPMTSRCSGGNRRGEDGSTHD